MIDYGLEPKLKEIFDYLSSKSREAYKDTYLLANETLSKNPFSCSFVRDFIEIDSSEWPKKIQLSYILKSFFGYYVRNGYVFICFVLNFIIFKLLHGFTGDRKNNLTVIDTFFMADKILQSGEFYDNYLCELGETLMEQGEPFLYLARFYGAYSPIKMLKILKILKRQNANFVSDYDLVSFTDLFRIAVFFATYPFSILRYLKAANCRHEDILFKKSMIGGMGDVVVTKYARYIAGRRFAFLNADRIRLISWFENQTVDKCLFAGVRHSGVDCFIIGVQAFLFAKRYISALVDEAEMNFGCVPDKVLVNGIRYLPNSTTVSFRVGPSFRYKKIFDTALLASAKTSKETIKILVLLSFDKIQNEKMLSCFFDLSLDYDFKIVIKPHQDLTPDSYERLVKKIPKATVVHSDIYSLFQNVDLVVGASSGTLIEALSFGVKVLQFCRGGFEYKILEGYGKGLFWDDFYSQKELSEKLRNFVGNITQEGKDEIRRYCMGFFSEPTKESIIGAVAY